MTSNLKTILKKVPLLITHLFYYDTHTLTLAFDLWMDSFEPVHTVERIASTIVVCTVHTVSLHLPILKTPSEQVLNKTKHS